MFIDCRGRLTEIAKKLDELGYTYYNNEPISKHLDDYRECLCVRDKHNVSYGSHIWFKDRENIYGKIATFEEFLEILKMNNDMLKLKNFDRITHVDGTVGYVFDEYISYENGEWDKVKAVLEKNKIVKIQRGDGVVCQIFDRERMLKLPIVWEKKQSIEINIENTKFIINSGQIQAGCTTITESNIRLILIEYKKLNPYFNY